MRDIVFELCAESIGACVAGEAGGADRIELCSGLSEGGVTPSHGFIKAAIEACKVPVHVLVRPRPGNFVYNDAEFAVLREDLVHARSLGASGFVLGLLQPDGTVDTERTRALVELASPLEVTFHRAFDCAADPKQALEQVIAIGCRRLLTSGGAADVVAGAAALARLVTQAAGRIEIAVGGGLRIENAAGLVRATGARHFHSSLRRSAGAALSKGPESGEQVAASAAGAADSADVRRMLEALRKT